MRETFFSSQLIIVLKGFQKQSKVVYGMQVHDGKMCFSVSL